MFDWNEHAGCPRNAATPERRRVDCNGERAAMIAQGLKLEAENARLREALANVAMGIEPAAQIESREHLATKHFQRLLKIARGALEAKP